MKIDQEVLIKQILTAVERGHAIVIGGIEVNTGGEFSFEGYLESLPTPRLHTLVERAKMVAMTRCPSQRKAAEWLGVSPMTMKRFDMEELPETIPSDEHSSE